MMTQLIGNFEDLPEKKQMEIVNEIASEGLPDGMIGIAIKWADDDQNLADEYFELHPGHEDSDLDDAIRMFLENKGAEYSPENQAKLTMAYAGKEDEEIDLAPGMSKSEIICDELMKKIKAKFGEELNSLTSLSLATLKSNLLEHHNWRDDRESGIEFEEYSPEMGRSWLNQCHEVWTDDKKNVAIREECGDGWDVMTSEDYEKI